MDNVSQNQLKGLFMNALVNYIYKNWGSNVTGVKVDEEKTFTDVLRPTFYEKKEGNVDDQRANIPHSYGILWTVKDIEIKIAENLNQEEDVTVFSKTYVNDTDAPIQISEKMEQGISITDTCEIGFTEKINAGYEQTISVGVDIVGIKASSQSKFTMGLELGANQTTTKTVQETTTSGFTLEMEVPAKSTREVQVTATKKSCNVLKDAIFIPRGKAYVQVAYDGHAVEDEHTYVIEFDKIDSKDFQFPVNYLLGASVHRDFHVRILSKNDVVSSYPLAR